MRARSVGVWMQKSANSKAPEKTNTHTHIFPIGCDTIVCCWLEFENILKYLLSIQLFACVCVCVCGTSHQVPELWDRIQTSTTWKKGKLCAQKFYVLCQLIDTFEMFFLRRKYCSELRRCLFSKHEIPVIARLIDVLTSTWSNLMHKQIRTAANGSQLKWLKSIK